MSEKNLCLFFILRSLSPSFLPTFPPSLPGSPFSLSFFISLCMCLCFVSLFFCVSFSVFSLVFVSVSFSVQHSYFLFMEFKQQKLGVTTLPDLMFVTLYALFHSSHLATIRKGNRLREGFCLKSQVSAQVSGRDGVWTQVCLACQLTEDEDGYLVVSPCGLSLWDHFS